MSPKLERLANSAPDLIATSIGGSVFRPERLNIHFIQELSSFFQELLKQNMTIFAVVGGGGIARSLEEDVRQLPILREPGIDQVGIAVTQTNLIILKNYFEEQGITFSIYKPGDLVRRGAGIIYLQAGTDPGHTTDYVTIRAAFEAGHDFVVNISREPGGINKRRRGKPVKDLYEEMAWDEYFQVFPQTYEPGMNIPFDPNAAGFAQKHGMTVVLVGPDINNLRSCLAGKDFKGTIVHP